MQKGINFDKYDAIPVEITGSNSDRFQRPIQDFDEANLYDAFLRNVRKAKYEKPTPIQKYGIPIIAAGRDVMGCAQTGSGKTVSLFNFVCLL